MLLPCRKSSNKLLYRSKAPRPWQAVREAHFRLQTSTKYFNSLFQSRHLPLKIVLHARFAFLLTKRLYFEFETIYQIIIRLEFYSDRIEEKKSVRAVQYIRINFQTASIIIMYLQLIQNLMILDIRYS